MAAPPLARQLEDLTGQLSDMGVAVAAALQHATTALLDRRERLAVRVIAGDREVDELRASVERTAAEALLFHAPVAGDLRAVVSAIRTADELERMGDLALHVAKTTRRRHPASVLPEQVQPYFAEMGRIACELATKAGDVIRTRDLERARELESDDDAMDDLHKHMFTVMMSPDWTHGVAAAVDATLLARFYERYGDHAVAVARRTIYVVTGQMPNAVEV